MDIIKETAKVLYSKHADIWEAVTVGKIPHSTAKDKVIDSNEKTLENLFKLGYQKALLETKGV
jgi:hypothetical protein